MDNKLEAEDKPEDKLTMREVLENNIQFNPGSLVHTIMEENKRLGKLGTEKIELYNRIIEAYGPYFEKEDGIKIQLLAEEILETFSLKVFWSLTKEEIIDIINRYIQNEKKSIAESRTKIIEEGCFTKDHQKSNETLFHYFIGEKKNLEKHILTTYTNSTPKQIVSIIYALSNLKVIDKGILDTRSHLHRILKNTFKNLGSRQALNENINNLGSPNQSDKLIIIQYEKEFKHYL